MAHMERQIRYALEIAFFVIAVFIGYWWKGTQITPAQPHKGVWIEFENLQHAIDSAAKLGGAKRGLSICLQTSEKIDQTLWNPGISIHGNLELCGYKKGEQFFREMMVYNHTPEPMTIDNVALDGSSRTIRSNSVSGDTYILGAHTICSDGTATTESWVACK